MLCREYRIPIKAALNGTAGAHTLKVVISPAATVANQKAADYKYNVPGLTQPGGLPSHHTSLHDHPAMLSAADIKCQPCALSEYTLEVEAKVDLNNSAVGMSRRL